MAKDRTPASGKGSTAGRRHHRRGAPPRAAPGPSANVVTPQRPWGLIAARSSSRSSPPRSSPTPSSRSTRPTPTRSTSVDEIAGVKTYDYPAGQDARDTPVDYTESPPVGGPHAPPPSWADCTGTVYTVDIRHENAVHSLEHGAVWITYNPDDVSKADIDTLAEAGREQDRPDAVALRGPGLADQHPVLGPPAEGGLGRRQADQAVRRLLHAEQRSTRPSPAPAARTPTSSPTRWSPARPAPPVGSGAMPTRDPDRPSAPATSSAPDRSTTDQDAVTHRRPSDRPQPAAGRAGRGHRRRRWSCSAAAWPSSWASAGRRRAGPARVDVGFSRDMAAHHLQGVEMANLVADHSEDPAVRGLAFDIATTQTNQVGRMQGWLALWGYSPTGGDQMAWMGARHGRPCTCGGRLAASCRAWRPRRSWPTCARCTGTAFDVEFLG